VTRYNPDTGRKTKVPADSVEAMEWPSRKPAAQTKTQKAAMRRAETQIARTVERGAGRAVAKVAGGLAAAGQAAGLGAGATAAYLASAGLISYAATRAILEGAAQGQTPVNLVSKARSMAVTAFHRKLGRFPTHAEYADVRKRVGQAILDHFAAATGSVPAMWRNFVGLFKGE
jgi:hypothetical protein